ncbi:MAG: hypothetical protein KDD82_23725 [Planctomycetes bacterium]|nr:hypothetical protein [Planctomycetota bacterium]
MRSPLRFCSLAALVAFGLCACSAPPPQQNPGPSTAREGALSQTELLRRARLAEVVIVGSVEKRFDEAEGTRYRVRVTDLLSRSQTAADQTQHPHENDTQIEVTDQLFVPQGQELVIGGLEPFVNYVFVLVPGYAPNRWLNLVDPSQYPFPGARELSEELRGVHDPAPRTSREDK